MEFIGLLLIALVVGSILIRSAQLKNTGKHKCPKCGNVFSPNDILSEDLLTNDFSNSSIKKILVNLKCGQCKEYSTVKLYTKIQSDRKNGTPAQQYFSYHYNENK